MSSVASSKPVAPVRHLYYTCAREEHKLTTILRSLTKKPIVKIETQYKVSVARRAIGRKLTVSGT